MAHNRDRRPPMVAAMQWVNRLTTISLEMVLPALGGYYLDEWLGTNPVFVALGGILGFAVAMRDLLRIAKSQSPNGGSRSSPSGSERGSKNGETSDEGRNG